MMKQKTSLIYALLLFLVACMALDTGRLSSEESGFQAVELVTSMPQVSQASTQNTRLGLVTQSEESDGLTGRLVNPLTLADLPDYEPINFGHHYTYAFSPNGRMLALIAWPGGSHNKNGLLAFIELPAWKVIPTEVTFEDFVSPLRFGPDGRALYWVQATRRDPAHGIPSDYELYRYELDSGQVTAVTSLPQSFSPWDMHPLPSGRQLAIYGLPTTTNNLAKDVPQVLLIDLTSGAIAADIPLDGVMAGQLHIQTATEDESPYRMVRPGLAWDLDNGLFYVAHADEDKITVVDLVEAEVYQQTDIRARQSILDRFLSWGAQVAKAKIVPGTDKQAVLSPDGNRLYIAGLHREMWQAEDEEGWSWREIPLGLQIIATGDLSEEQWLDLPVTDLALSPDGKWLLLKGAYDKTGPGGDIERVKQGLFLVDTESMTVTAHLLPENEVFLQGFSPDGRQAYVSTATSEWLVDHYGNWRVTLHVLDLQSGQFVVEREFPGGYLDVIP